MERTITKLHNNPPSEIDILKDRLAGYEVEKELFRLSQREIPAEISNGQEAGSLSDYISAVKVTADKVSEIHKKEKKPFWDAGKAADSWKNDFEEKLNALVKKASTPLLAWNKKKEEEERQRQLEIARKAREEADKLIEEAQAHAQEGIEDTAQDLLNAAVEADAKADMIQGSAYTATARTRGGFSSSSIKRTWVGEIESQAAIDLEILRFYFKPEEILSALNRAVRDGKRDIRGAKIFQQEDLTNRRRI